MVKNIIEAVLLKHEARRWTNVFRLYATRRG